MESPRLLVVDDDETIVKVIRKVTEGLNLEVLSAIDGEIGLETYKFSNPDIILLDWNLGEGKTGLPFLKAVRAQDQTASILILTANDDIETKVTAYNAGADDYVVKPFQMDELKARIKSHLRINQLTKELFAANLKLQDLVLVDELTNLYKPKPGFDRIDLDLKRSRRLKLCVALVMVDIRDLGKLNEKHGHEFGSFVLSRIGAIISDTIREVDFAIRFGGDEFLICLNGTNVEGSKVFCDRLIKNVHGEEFQLGDAKDRVKISSGIAVSKPGSFIDCESLMKESDKALRNIESSEKIDYECRSEEAGDFTSPDPPPHFAMALKK